MSKRLCIALPTLVLLAWVPGAQAHMGTGAVGGFSAGFMHPILGWDHVIDRLTEGL